MKRMLFNAAHAEETRVAIVEGQKLVDIDIEVAGHESRKSNIYKGIITRIEPSLEACFIDYGDAKHGFLSFKEVGKQYFKEGIAPSNAKIQEALSVGQELLVQLEKEERGNKGAALTSFISLAGRYMVLMPNNPRGGGVSRRIDGEDRHELRALMDQLNVPHGMGVIARTAAIDRTLEELQWDLNYLLQLWKAIEGAGQAQGAFLIYQESSLIIRAIRDYFSADIKQILIDNDEVYEQAHQFVGYVMPDMAERVVRYNEDIPLFTRFQIEHQIETAHSRQVPLPSGGSIVIDHTEALVAIDVNSARATKGGDIEETATRTNLEAAEEVARQLRLRDLGGLVVIDFIDMEESKNQRAVEAKLKEGLRHDRARLQMGKISRFGLMELSRQRLRPSLAEGSHIACPRCNGVGSIRDVNSTALHILRVVEEEAMKEGVAALHIQVPIDVATFLLNEKRLDLASLENRLNIHVVLIPNRHIETPYYKLERIKHDDNRLESVKPTHTLLKEIGEDTSVIHTSLNSHKNSQVAKVTGVTPPDRAPIIDRKSEMSGYSSHVSHAKVPEQAAGTAMLWSKVKAFFMGGQQSSTPLKTEAEIISDEKQANVSQKHRHSATPSYKERSPRTPQSNKHSKPKPSVNQEADSTTSTDLKAPHKMIEGSVRANNASKNNERPVKDKDIKEVKEIKEVKDFKERKERRPERERNPEVTGDKQDKTIRPQRPRIVKPVPDESLPLTLTSNETHSVNPIIIDAVHENHTNALKTVQTHTEIVVDEEKTDENIARSSRNSARHSRNPRHRRDSNKERRTDNTVDTVESAIDTVESSQNNNTVKSIVQALPVKTETVITTIPAPIVPVRLEEASLQSLSKEAGLEWVNTDSTAFEAMKERLNNQPKPSRVPRERPKSPVIVEEPLQMMETKKVD